MKCSATTTCFAAVLFSWTFTVACAPPTDASDASDAGHDGEVDGAAEGANEGDAEGATEGDPIAPIDCELSACSFCDAATWASGLVPTANDDVVIPAGKTVLIDCDAHARRLTIAEDGTLRAARDVSTTLTMHGNLVVQGMLDYGTPEDRILGGVTAEIVFADLPSDDLVVGTPSPEFEVGDLRPSVEVPVSVVDGDAAHPLGQGHLMDPEVFRDLRECHARFTVSGYPDHIVAELLRIRLRHDSHPSRPTLGQARSDVTYTCSSPVSPLQFSVLASESLEFGRFLSRCSRPLASIDLGPTTPLADRFWRTYPE